MHPSQQSHLWERKRWMLLSAPIAAVIGFTLLLPLASNAYHSLFTGPLSKPYGIYCGLQNYGELVSDGRFWESLSKGFCYAGVSSALQVGLACMAAIGLRRMSHLSALARGLCLVPVLVPPAATVAVFRMLFDSTFGPLAHASDALFGVKPNLFGEHSLLLTAAGVTAIQFFPLSFLLLSERICLIPASLYQRAELDGLGPWHTLRIVTIPEIAPVVAALMALRFCLTFGKFDVLYFLGGTSASFAAVESVPLYIYRAGLTQGKLGFGAAASTLVLVLAVSVMALLYLLKSVVPAMQSVSQRRTRVDSRSAVFRRGQTAIARFGSFVGLAVIFTTILIPIMAVVYGSLSVRFASGNLDFTLEHFQSLFLQFEFSRCLLNSVMATTLATAVILFVSVPFSFLLWVYRFPGSSWCNPFSVICYCLPPILLVYGFQSISASLGMLGTPIAVSAGLVGFTLPLAATILTTFGNDHPVTHPAESASESISVARYFVRVFLPNRIGAICMSAALVFAACWSDYLFASIIGGAQFRTAVVSFQDIFQGAVIPWGVLMAAALVLAVPTAAASLVVEFVLKRRTHEHGI